MKKINELEIEANYYEIVCRLIYEYNIFSVVKIVFISFSLYSTAEFYEGTVQKYNLLDYIVSGIKIGLTKNPNHFSYIFDCLNLLTKAKMIDIVSGNIKRMAKPRYERTNDLIDSPKNKRAICEIEKLTDESLIKEIIEYV